MHLNEKKYQKYFTKNETIPKTDSSSRNRLQP